MGEHSFIKETIKEKPFHKKKALIICLLFIICCAVGGCVAALGFHMVGTLLTDSEEAAPVTIAPAEETEDVEADESENKVTTQIVEVPAALEISDYQQFYRDMTAAAQEASKSLVTVTGITADMDWFNNSFEKEQQISGLIVADNGENYYIVTEYRIVESADKVQVTFCDDVSVDAELQKADPATGLCVLVVSASAVTKDTADQIAAATLGSGTTAKQGDPVILLGRPLGYGNTTTFGELTSSTNSVAVTDGEYTLLTTNIQGDKKSSGVLLNANGGVIGIVLQSLASSTKVVTCVTVSEITKLVENLSNNTEIPYVGIIGATVSEQIVAETGLPQGVYITEVEIDSPAMNAGCKNGDIITKIGDKVIENNRQYASEIKKYAPGDVITVTGMREGAEGYSEITFDVTIGSL